MVIIAGVCLTHSLLLLLLDFEGEQWRGLTKVILRPLVKQRDNNALTFLVNSFREPEQRDTESAKLLDLYTKPFYNHSLDEDIAIYLIIALNAPLYIYIKSIYP